MAKLIHKNCGGIPMEVKASNSTIPPFVYVAASGKIEFHYPTYCTKCGKMILGDIDLEFEGEEEEGV